MAAYVSAGQPTLATYGAQHVERYWTERARYEVVMAKTEPAARVELEQLRPHYAVVLWGRGGSSARWSRRSSRRP